MCDIDPRPGQYEETLAEAPDLDFTYHLDSRTTVHGFDFEGTYIGWEAPVGLLRADPRVSLEGDIFPALLPRAPWDCTAHEFRALRVMREDRGLVVLLATTDGGSVLRVRVPIGTWSATSLAGLVRGVLAGSALGPSLVAVEVLEEQVTVTFADLDRRIGILLEPVAAVPLFIALIEVLRRRSVKQLESHDRAVAQPDGRPGSLRHSDWFRTSGRAARTLALAFTPKATGTLRLTTGQPTRAFGCIVANHMCGKSPSRGRFRNVFSRSSSTVVMRDTPTLTCRVHPLFRRVPRPSASHALHVRLTTTFTNTCSLGLRGGRQRRLVPWRMSGSIAPRARPPRRLACGLGLEVGHDLAQIYCLGGHRFWGGCLRKAPTRAPMTASCRMRILRAHRSCTNPRETTATTRSSLTQMVAR